jgi:predicted RNA polymerase sigma factor
METAEALKIIEALADGLDPHAGEVFPPDSPYQNPQTIRALFAAKSALERVRRTERRKKALPERAGQPWDEEESTLLLDEFEQGISVKELAIKHKRTQRAIISQLLKMGRNPSSA